MGARRSRVGRAPTYSFGDSELAAARLARVAANFEPASRAFLECAAPREVGRALDLGCGPGHTTRLLHALCAPRELVGLDGSEAFVACARETSPAPEIAFVVHDVTQVPLPGGPADLIYARLLLSHLADPESAIAAWRGELRPGGRLLLDEVESIRSEDPVFARYLDLVRELLWQRGQELDIGPRVERATRGPQRVHCELRELTLAPARVAEMFAPNLEELRMQPAIRARASAGELDGLAAALRARAAGEGGKPVTWALRQTALEA